MSFQGSAQGLTGQAPSLTVSGAAYATTVGYAPSVTQAAVNAGYAYSVYNATNAGTANATQSSGNDQVGYAYQIAQGAYNFNLNNGQQPKNTAWNWQGQYTSQAYVWGSSDGSYINAFLSSNWGVGNTFMSNNAGNLYTTAGSSTWAWSGTGGTPAWMVGSQGGGSNINVFPPGNTYVGGAYYINGNIAGYAGSCYTAQQLAQNAYNIQQIGMAIQGGLYQGNGIYVGLCLTAWNNGTLGAFWATKRSQAGSSADRFAVFYNPENNYVQYGYWNGGWGNVSDGRQKEGIQDLDENDCVTFIKKLRPRKFKWKKELTDEKEYGKENVGFIAQEVLEATSNVDSSFRSIVNNADEYIEKGGGFDIENSYPDTPILGVSMESMTPTLVKTVQYLLDEIEIMRARIVKLKS